ncbi:MAG: hypothetical protein A4E66_01312 [Syntrophus sp. PtaB.Bin001]|nr:MAG: hypothetical protein A4E66_01312 [Syntrophus sp. PtaB.Bin001]
MVFHIHGELALEYGISCVVCGIGGCGRQIHALGGSGQIKIEIAGKGIDFADYFHRCGAVHITVNFHISSSGEI